MYVGYKNLSLWQRLNFFPGISAIARDLVQILPASGGKCNEKP